MSVVVLIISVAMVSGKAAPLVDLLEAADGDVDIGLFRAAAVLLIVVSALVLVLTFLGCCGALKESRCLLGLYFAALLCMFVAMIVGAVVGYSQSLEEVNQVLLDSITEYDPDSTDKDEVAITKAWDQIQKDVSCLPGRKFLHAVCFQYFHHWLYCYFLQLQFQFECCGVNEYQDWEENPKVKNNISFF